jgi:hypothetical protein
MNKLIQIKQLSATEYDVIRLGETNVNGHVRLESDEMGWVLDVFIHEQHQETIELGKHRPDWSQVVNEMLNWNE